MEKIGAILSKFGDWIAPIAAISMVFVMLVPLPSFMLDLMLTISITASMLVLLTAIQILRPFSSRSFRAFCFCLRCFVCLSTWPARAAFCFTATRAHRPPAKLSKHLPVCSRRNYIVGFVLFLALIAIQFLVISHARCARQKSQPLYSRRDAGQANGDRRRLECRPHQ